MNFKVLDIAMSKSENLGFTICGSIDKYLRVENVKINGRAYEAGLQNGDCILMMNGVQIHNRDDIINVLRLTENMLKIRVIRKNMAIKEDVTGHRSSTLTRNIKTVIRRSSMQESGSLHREIFQNIGSRVSMEITRDYPGIMIPRSDRIQFFENSVQTNGKDGEVTERRNSNHSRISQNSLDLINKSNSCHDIPNVPRTVSKVKSIQTNPRVPIRKTSDQLANHEQKLSTSIPTRYHNKSTNEHDIEKSSLNFNLSLRKKSKSKNLYSNLSLSNMSNFSKSVQNLPFTIDIENPPLSAFNNNTSSMMSLFDDDASNSLIGEYKIDWRAIYAKVSVTTINDIEKELISYFTNNHTDLKIFPVNSMYRYITFNGVLEIVFNNILPADSDVDFHEQILQIPNDIFDIDYDMNSYDIVKLMKCNVKKIGGQVREYMERKSDLNLAKEKLKETLDEYLKKPEDSMKMHSQIDRIYKIFYELSNFLTSMVIAMSMWKFSKDFTHLYESMSYQTNILTTSETLLSEFRRSQRNLEKNIINLFRRFKEESSEDVLKLFDKLFSETLDLSICIPLFHDKLKRDNEMLGHLENCGVRESVETPRRSQYV